MIYITWYSNWLVYVGIFICACSILFTLLTSLICLFEDKIFIEPFISFLIVVLSITYLIMATNKQQEILVDNYKYKIKLIRGKSSDLYYTNSYKIEDGMIYFDGNCSNNFTVELNK